VLLEVKRDVRLELRRRLTPQARTLVDGAGWRKVARHSRRRHNLHNQATRPFCVHTLIPGVVRTYTLSPSNRRKSQQNVIRWSNTDYRCPQRGCASPCNYLVRYNQLTSSTQAPTSRRAAAKSSPISTPASPYNTPSSPRLAPTEVTFCSSTRMASRPSPTTALLS
jgi:hypothetical protein